MSPALLTHRSKETFGGTSQGEGESKREINQRFCAPFRRASSSAVLLGPAIFSRDTKPSHHVALLLGERNQGLEALVTTEPTR